MVAWCKKINFALLEQNRTTMLLYNIAIHIYTYLIKVAGKSSQKAKLWHEGRINLFDRLREAINDDDKIIWIHVASLGEFEQARPIIEKIKSEKPEYKILLTFFSPSGYEMRKAYKGADYIFYLPADTPNNAREFLDIVKPEIAIFVKYEFWLNLLFELRKREIRTFIVSAIFRKKSIFFKCWGYKWREALKSFKTIFVQDENSKQLLSSIGFNNTIVAGDTRFDRVAEIVAATKEIPYLDLFKGDKLLLMAGSTWPADEQIINDAALQHPNIKILVAPHEIHEKHVGQVEELFGDKCVRYTSIMPDPKESDAAKKQSEREEKLQKAQMLILDTMGMLSSAYRYADISYIGGGFGAGIHNTLEAATFGLPVAFGPKYAKFKEAVDLISVGASVSISSREEFDSWLTPLITDAELRTQKSEAARKYCAEQCGATDAIMKELF